MKYESKDILDKIYEIRSEEFDDIIKIKSQEIEQKYKNINKNIKIDNMEDDRNINNIEMQEIIKSIEEKYNEKMAILIRECYKDGFKDGVNLILNCLKNN